MLYFQLGWASFTAIAVLILMMPVQVRTRGCFPSSLPHTQRLTVRQGPDSYTGRGISLLDQRGDCQHVTDQTWAPLLRHSQATD
jgi:hypothetical protein